MPVLYAVFGSFEGATLSASDVRRLTSRSDVAIDVVNSAGPIKVRCNVADNEIDMAIRRMREVVQKVAADAHLTNVNAVELTPQPPHESAAASAVS